MQKHIAVSFLLFSLLLILFMGGLCCLLSVSEGESVSSDRIEIRQDGKVLYTMEEEELYQDRIIYIPYGEEHYNEIEIKDGHIHIHEADCPDGLCVKMGELERDGAPIVCLPHRLEIRYVK